MVASSSSRKHQPREIPLKRVCQILLATLLISLGLVFPLSMSFTSRVVEDLVMHSFSSSPLPPDNEMAKDHRETIAYVISITSCSPKFAASTKDMAAVLKKSIDMHSWPRNPNSRYKSEAFVLGTPETAHSRCIAMLQKAGFTHRVVDLPVQLPDIAHVEGAENLPQSMPSNGCCGEKEFLKLHVYSMTDFQVALHLDLDTLLVQPLDPLFDAMIQSPQTEEGLQARQRLFAPPLTHSDNNNNNKSMNQSDFPYRRLASALYEPDVPLEELTINAYYTRDYNMYPRRVQKMGGKVGIQGGVMIVRPNNETRDEIVQLVQMGQFYHGRGPDSGWFQKGYGYVRSLFLLLEWCNSGNRKGSLTSVFRSLDSFLFYKKQSYLGRQNHTRLHGLLLQRGETCREYRAQSMSLQSDCGESPAVFL